MSLPINLLVILTLIYIIIIVLFFRYNNSYSTDNDNQDTDETSDLNKFFIKNKTLISFIFGIVGLICLIFTWVATIFKPTFDSNYLKIPFFIIIVLGLFSGIIYLFSYSPTVLIGLLNIINILIISSVVALFSERFYKKTSALIVGLLMGIFFLFSIGWISGLILGIVGLIIGHSIGKNPNKGKSVQTPFWEFLNFIGLILSTLPYSIKKLAIFISKILSDAANPNNKNNWIIIIGIILFLVLIKLILPLIYKYVVKQTLPPKNIITTDAISTHNSNNLGNFISHEQEINNNSEKTYMNYNYALSFWLWIFPLPETTSPAYNKSTSLLNLSNIINIKYNNNNIEFWANTIDNSSTEKLIKIFEFKDFKYQKWNNIIINYHGGTLDIFMTGKLSSSTPNIIPLSNSFSATIGSKNGIYGGIKDIVYYKDILTQHQINLINNII